LIQPCRGAPPEPFGDGTQASFQPSLNSVASDSGRQVFGSGFPKIDWVMVSQIPGSTLEGVGSEFSQVSSKGTAPVGWEKVPGPPKTKVESEGGVGLGNEGV
jgi:hypothetical protein